MHKINYLTHNWLILKINNNFIKKNLRRVNGICYDLGCGTRPYERDILEYAKSYIGVDWSSSPHGLVADLVINLNNLLPLDDRIADTVVSFQVLEHLCEPQIMLNEAFRILKPGGTLLLSVPFQWSVHEAPYDYFRFTTFGIDYILKKSGFTNIEIVECTGFWVMWLLKLNYQLKKLVMGPIPVAKLINLILLPIFIFNQLIGFFLDIFWKSKGETAVYFISASKG